ncbi:SNF2-related protein [Nitzschia inconspicua]|uniref:SNF2-related protein n=1 Tax=Nitzschia inconspicua TaxID=303405 RepID=A0A9K3Q344_9STRA|nr:SNF2-related protein [Nitzschia inconspicua]
MLTGGTLRDYQKEGLTFLVNNHRRNCGMILGDEMGLGKTVQTISLLCYLKEVEGKTGPSLVVCPLSVLSSWMKELKFWAPALKVFRLHNSNSSQQEKSRQAIMDSVVEYDVVLTTYEMVKAPSLNSFFQRLHFHYTVLDEGHKVKSNETLVSGAVRKIHSENRLLLTGTPLQNNLVELWSLLELLYPDVFTTSAPFEKSFNLTENRVDETMLAHARQLLRVFMIRREKAKVEKLLPEKLETRVYCPLSKEQVFMYKAILMKDLSILEQLEQKVSSAAGDGEGAVKSTSKKILQNLFMQLRKVSQHPYLFEGMEGPNTTLAELVAASGKLAVLDMLLISLFRKGHRCVLFSQFTMVLDILEDYCIERGWKYARFDGGTSRAKRDYLVNRFNDQDSPFFLFLMSTKSGGVGLNLQTADTAILYDSDWNPQNDLQAMGRVHRIGQKKTVHVYRLVTSNSVEERMVERANKKLLLDHSVNRDLGSARSNSSDDDTGLSVKDMLKDIKFGANAIFGKQTLDDLPSWDDIEHITDRSRKNFESLGKLEGGAEETGASFDAQKEFTASQLFGGVDYRKIREEQERKAFGEIPKSLRGIGDLWHSIRTIEGTTRERKSRLVMVDGKGTGYGKQYVPILASNNYDLDSGESSVFGRELGKSQQKLAAVPSKRVSKFENSPFCQVCQDGGSLVVCPNCPVSLHIQCCGLTRTKDFQRCFHHRCVECDKTLAEAGGLLYPCAICPWAWCEDCLDVTKAGFRYLGSYDRWEKLGFNSTKNAVYIHCSAACEAFACKEYKWKPDEMKQVCPEELDVSSNFGVQGDMVNLCVDRTHQQTQQSHPSPRKNGIKTSRATCRSTARMVSSDSLQERSTPKDGKSSPRDVISLL